MSLQIAPSGNIFFIDEYGTQYTSQWETIGESIDMTTITKMPYVWNEEAEARIEGRIVYRRGIITITRQILRSAEDGYMIVAEGGSQYIDFFQTNFPCGPVATDPFLHHLDKMILDSTEFKILDGPRWADPDDPDDEEVLWSDLTSAGAPMTGTTAGVDDFGWVDVWDSP